MQILLNFYEFPVAVSKTDLDIAEKSNYSYWSLKVSKNLNKFMQNPNYNCSEDPGSMAQCAQKRFNENFKFDCLVPGLKFFFFFVYPRKIPILF